MTKRETVTIPVKVDRYVLNAVPGRYFRLGNGNFVASVRKADYFATMPDGKTIQATTKDEIQRRTRVHLYRAQDNRRPVFQFNEEK